jgi:hypothetical protein
MIQGGEDARLALEPGQTLGIRGEAPGEYLDGDFAAELRVPSPIHLSHAA